MRLVSELRRRNVFRMAVLYLVTAWLIMQVTEVLLSLTPLPEWIGQAVREASLFDLSAGLSSEAKPN